MKKIKQLSVGVGFVAYAYAGLLFLWFLLNLVFGDRWGWLFLLNTGAVYLLLPLPLWLIRPFITKRIFDRWLALALLTIGWMRFGHLITPNIRIAPTNQTVTVMTTNLLGSNQNLTGIEHTFLASGADVIAIQELSPAQASLLQNSLLEVYPYQLLDPQVGVTGMGLISRYPLEPLPLPWPDLYWVGTPQLVEMVVNETAVQLINFHAIPPIGFPLPDPQAIKIREAQAKQLAQFKQQSAHPVILLGDLNATDQSRAYTYLKAEFQDSWAVGGWGLGNSWPSHQINLFNIARLPSWLVRIDHIFVSHEWRIVASQIGPWDGGADHRPILVTLELPP